MSPDHLCQRVEHEVATLLEPDRPADLELAELERHLDRCDACALALARAQRDAAAIAALGDGFALPDDMIQRVLQAAGPARAPAGTRRLEALWGMLWGTVPGRLALLGSGLALAIWAVVAAPHDGAPPAPPAARPVLCQLTVVDGRAERQTPSGWRPLRSGQLDLRQPLRTGPRARAELTLPDGTRILLNRATTLLADAEGGLYLVGGELLADVRPRAAARPLVIRVPTGQVMVLGTKLHLSADADLALVDVIHGTVRVASQAGEALVFAGQEGVLPRGGPPLVSIAPDLGQTLSWTEDTPEGPSADPLPSGLGSLTAQRPGRGGKAIHLRLKEHAVQVRAQGGLARTEITETFENPTRHTLEGIYRFPMPAGARISRLALYVDGRLEEGTVVERDRAQKIWRGVIRQATPKALRKQEEYIWVPGPWRDPALLQWREGNQFELRIFPIPARGSRKVILAYTESLPRTARGRRYVYPLPRSRDRNLRADRFRLDLALSGHEPAAPVRVTGYEALAQRSGDTHSVTFEAEAFEPAGDLVVDFATAASSSPLVVRTYRSPTRPDEAGYVLFSLKTELPAYRGDRPHDVVLLVDRSHSTLGESGRRELMLVQALLGEMDPRDRVAVLACDSTCRQIAGWVAPDAAEARRVTRALGRVKPGGATDIGEALRRAGALLQRRGEQRDARVIYVGDGTPTVGELETAALVGLTRKHLAPLGARLTTVGVGGSVDAALLATLSRTTGGSYVAYAPGMTTRGQALQVLARQYGVTLEQVKIALPEGVTRAAPKEIAVLHQGEELVLVGRARSRIAGEVVLSGRVNGEPFRVAHPVNAPLSESEGNAFLPRWWAQLYIDDLLADSATDRQTVVELSKRHYLLTRYTSLLVLESEAMRRAFGVAQGERAEAWTGHAAAEESNEAERETEKRDAHAHAVGRGSLGTLGHGYGRGSGGGGSDSTRAKKLRLRSSNDPLAGLDLGGGGGNELAFDARTKAGGRRSSRSRGTDLPRDHVPSVPPARRGVSVMGSLDRSAIQRVVRRNLSSLRRVYERQLRSDPNLVGRLALRITIGPTGQVLQAGVQGSTLNDPALERELARVVSTWRFPAAKGGGMVTVVYPLVFRAAGSGDAPDRSTRSEIDRLVDRAVGPRPTPPSTPLPRGRRWIRMKRVYYQEATLARRSFPTGHDRSLVALRQRALDDNPDSRDRHRRLYTALSRAGDAAEALQVVERWLSRDPHSSEALELLAEVAARLGERERALRALGSLVELDRSNVALHTRLSAMRDALGQTRAACAHWLALATLSPGEDAARRRAADCREGFRPSDPPSRPRGTVVLRASWQGDEDLDLALITPRGERLGWLSNRARIRFASATSHAQEQLALRWLPPGRYRIEVNRGDPAAPAELRGHLTVSAPGLTRRLTFRLDEGQPHTYVAELQIHRRSRLVPAP